MEIKNGLFKKAVLEVLTYDSGDKGNLLKLSKENYQKIKAYFGEIRTYGMGGEEIKLSKNARLGFFPNGLSELLVEKVKEMGEVEIASYSDGLERVVLVKTKGGDDYYVFAQLGCVVGASITPLAKILEKAGDKFLIKATELADEQREKLDHKTRELSTGESFKDFLRDGYFYL